MKGQKEIGALNRFSCRTCEVVFLLKTRERFFTSSRLFCEGSVLAVFWAGMVVSFFAFPFG